MSFCAWYFDESFSSRAATRSPGTAKPYCGVKPAASVEHACAAKSALASAASASACLAAANASASRGPPPPPTLLSALLASPPAASWAPSQCGETGLVGYSGVGCPESHKHAVLCDLSYFYMSYRFIGFSDVQKVTGEAPPASLQPYYVGGPPILILLLTPTYYCYNLR